MTMAGPEWTHAENPTIAALVAMGYAFIPPEDHESLRDGPNHVLLRPHVVEALKSINGLSEADAQAAFGELVGQADNAKWLSLLRGDFSRSVEGQATAKTLRLVDFRNPAANRFTVTRQFKVQAEKSRIPDIVIHLNGIPVVVIEAKSPMVSKSKTGEAFEQIKQYERDIPRLFAPSVFNIVTDGASLLYGATGSSAKFYGFWRDPWPKTDADFASDLDKGLWCLLEPSRLLDIIAHFVIFESDAESGKVVKKICRYHQFRAVNRIVERVVKGEHRQGLVWHTQGSGKSLTMVYTALKLKTHLTISSAELANPNLMVLTDRIDLDDQISRTFTACGLANPISIESIKQLHGLIRSGKGGLTVLSTIFKFAGSKEAVDDSTSWIVMVDECHRTQEKDLGAFLRATLPDARFFGFTGTPIKKDDKDTYRNFGVAGESYLDKYGIDDAVRDGATVPIFYTGRKTDWHIDEGKIDILFDQWFADLPQAKLDEIKARGVGIEDLVKHPKRIALIAFDIWTHFTAYAKPDGFKAQIVAVDREAVIAYRAALTEVIADDLAKGGLTAEEARTRADAMCACVFSQSQEDGKPSEDPHVDAVRAGLRRWYLDHDAEKQAKKDFNVRGKDPQFLIVCDKLLTGFDAPAESVMYLDKPLRDHSLLQAIARTNRVSDAKKRSGLIVDYIGVSSRLEQALSAYRAEDVANAMHDLDGLRSQLKAAHAAVLAMAKGIKRGTGDPKAEHDALIEALGTEDWWIEFRMKARAFIDLYQELSPDPVVLDFTNDMKWVAAFLPYATQVFEKKESIDHTLYSEKIREMLEEHLDATGLSTTVKLRHITDPGFWDDFETEGKDEDDLRRAAIRKTTELRKATSAKMEENGPRYAKFSDRLKKLLEAMGDAQLTWAEKLKVAENYAQDLEAEANAHQGTDLSETEYGVLQVLDAVKPEEASDHALVALAKIVDALYRGAPPLWTEKQEARKSLRQVVRLKVFELGFADIAGITDQIEDFALKWFRKD